jgi:hypothetical protein
MDRSRSTGHRPAYSAQMATMSGAMVTPIRAIVEFRSMPLSHYPV